MVEGLRRQYHFWPGKGGPGAGQDAWDVHRLIELTRDFPVEEVSLDSITEVDTVYWFDAEHRPTVRSVIEHAELMNAVDLTYPIILGTDGRVMDGMHRVARAILEGRATIPAKRFEIDPEPDHRNCNPADLEY